MNLISNPFDDYLIQKLNTLYLNKEYEKMLHTLFENRKLKKQSVDFSYILASTKKPKILKFKGYIILISEDCYRLFSF